MCRHGGQATVLLDLSTAVLVGVQQKKIGGNSFVGGHHTVWPVFLVPAGVCGLM
jgi:hypothetical protein